MAVKKERIPIPERKPEERVKDFEPIRIGYSLEMAVEEANRCIQCKNQPCVEQGCPAKVPIPQFIKLLREGDLEGAARELVKKSVLSSICGRVCAQEHQCEGACTIKRAGGEPVAIGALEHFVMDWAFENNVELFKRSEPTGKKVAVVGSGPGGMAAAIRLAEAGHDVVIFEALHEPGGVLRYGIPNYRLPRKVIDWYFEVLNKLGVELRLNTVVGVSVPFQELVDKYDAVCVFTGAGVPAAPRTKGFNTPGVYTANEFLMKINLMHADKFPEFDTPLHTGKRVAVIGGGNTAMDVARSAVRLKDVEEVVVVYRRSEAEMPANSDEIEEAKEEGVKFMTLTNPVRFIPGPDGKLQKMECIKMQLGEPDASGRRRPVPIEGSEFIMDVDCVVVATGFDSNSLAVKEFESIKLGKWGEILVDEETGRTSHPKVFAGGDVVRGASSVVLAMVDAFKVVKSINEMLSE